jgi:cellulose synthase/poly-beta-1,6-N-acetylglucosamine synthase-like glycosyltransferase
MCKENKSYKIKFIPDPVCWTEAPEQMKILEGQRNRWQRGLMESLFKYKHLLFNKDYGFLGKFAFPFNFLLEMFSPVFEFVGYITVVLSLVLGILNFEFALIFFTVSVFFGVVISMSTIILEELSFRRFPKIKHLFLLILYGCLENFGYRQLHAYWRFKGFIDYFKGEKTWGDMVRIGFSQLKSKSHF